jgi:hypothetical protein
MGLVSGRRGGSGTGRGLTGSTLIGLSLPGSDISPKK